MNLLKKLYCRVFQTAFRLMLPILPYREPHRLSKIEDIADILQDKGIKKALLVTDKGMRSLGVTAPLEADLKKRGIALAVYDEVCPNPTAENVEAALFRYQMAGCEAILAFGGGSPMDCAKGVGARVARPKKSLGQLAGLLKVRRKMPLFIAIPTTAGTGSEVTLAAVITDQEKKHKYVINSFALIPHYAVLDPTLTVSLPPHLTATTGMDALTHAVEAYIGRSTTKYTRQMAEQAVNRIFTYLPRAYENPKDLAAREQMLLASHWAGIAFTRSYVGYVHALAHALGGEYNTPHGLANAMLLPHVLLSYGKAAHKKLRRLALVAGIATPTDTPKTAAEKFIAAVTEANQTMGIPATLPALRPEDIPHLAAHADREANPLYPVPRLMSAPALAEIYQNILEI